MALTATVPAGITATFSPASIAAPGTGSSKLTLTVASNAAPGTYSVAVKAASGQFSQTETVSVTIALPPGFSLTASPTSLSVAQGGSTSTVIGLVPVNGFTGSVTVSYGPLPAGVLARWSSASNGAQLTFTAATGTQHGSYPIVITGTGGGVSPSPTVAVTLTVAAASKTTQ